jgi:hypothetical protein
VSKWKNCLVKNNITRDIHSVGRNMETLVAFMDRTITKEDTLFRTELKLATITWAEMRPACTTKDFEKSIIRRLSKEALKRSLHINDTARQAINEETRCGKSITPEEIRRRGMCRKS